MEARAVDGLVDLLELITVLKGEARSISGASSTRRSTAARRRRTRRCRAALAPWKAQTLATSIPQSEPLNQAQIERADIFTYAPESKGAIAYRTLAHEVIAVLARIGTERGDVTRTSLQERA
jgi:nitrogenase subunit NifH